MSKESRSFVLEPINAVEHVSFKGKVHDLEVEDDHSYVANGAAVHNSVCRTRTKTGFGKPQFSAILEVNKTFAGLKEKPNRRPPKIIADGGIKNESDVAKALLVSDGVMVGAVLAGTIETPGPVFAERGTDLVTRTYYKIYGGSASAEKKVANGKKAQFVEGEMIKVPLKGHAKYLLEENQEGIQSAFSYGGANNIAEFRKNVTWREISSGGQRESKV